MAGFEDWKFDGILSLGSPYLVKKFQSLCGIEFVEYDMNHVESHVQNDHPHHLNHRKHGNSSNGHSLHNGTIETHNRDLTVDNLTKEQAFVIRNKLLYYIFLLGASLGNEVFYCMLWSILFWYGDTDVARRVCLVWCFTLYLGQVLKEVIAWPRPRSPPVACLERRYQLEFGMPSTHAVVGVTVPYSLLYYLHLHSEIYNVCGVVICTVWCLLTAASRSYLGMHSILDVLGGLLVGSILLPTSILVVNVMDGLLLTNEHGALLTTGFMLSLCFLFPRLKTWNTSRADSYMLCAVTMGIYWTCRFDYLYPDWYANYIHVTDHVNEHVYLSVLCKPIIGGILLVITRQLFKTLATKCLCMLLHLDSENPESLKYKRFEMPYKFLVYVPLSAVVVSGCPFVFMALGI